MFKTPIDFKEQIAEARRTQILMGAAQVFSKKGYHQATTKEIAEAAELSEGTIYNYFDSKRELLIAMMELLGRGSLEEFIQDYPSTNSKQFLTTLLQDLYRLLQERGDFAVPILAEIFSDGELRQAFYQQLVHPIVTYVETYLKDQTPSINLRRGDPLIMAHALIGAVLLNFIFKATNLDSRFNNISAEAIIEQVVSLFSNDLYASKELAWLVS